MVDKPAPHPDSFEATLKKLEAVLARLERAELPLEDAIGAYEEGLQLVKGAQGKLDGMDARLQELMADGSTKDLQVRERKEGKDTR